MDSMPNYTEQDMTFDFTYSSYNSVQSRINIKYVCERC